MRVSATPDLRSAAIEVGWNMRTGPDKYIGLLSRIVAAGSAVMRCGSGALALAYVAAGRSDAFVEHHINAWDCLAGNLLVAEAGGYVNDFLGRDGLRRGGPLLACTPALARPAGRTGGARRRGALSDVALTSGAARLRIARLGAEARAWSVGGVELLWPGDPAIWPEISPILFPVVGWTRDGARVAGRQYDLQLHGFARRLTFEVADLHEDFARCVAHDDDGDARGLSRSRSRSPSNTGSAADSLSITLEVANSGNARNALRLRPASGL